MADSVKKTNETLKAMVGMALFLPIYIAVALAFLRQWGSPHPWMRLDLFSGGYLALSTFLATQQLVFGYQMSRSEELSREFFGIKFDPQWMRWAPILGLGELLVFLDYGQLHLATMLEIPILQIMGLVLYLLALYRLIVVDRYLSRHFASHLASGSLMTDGPYRRVRHPRYSGLIVTRIGLALVLTSLIGWIFVACWVWLVQRRIKLEEAYLVDIFGNTYEDYARRTARLIPGIY
jgi:protein-S-isoprenylcysteine O-methyltransferase Ste14